MTGGGTAEILDDGAAVRVTWPDGEVARFHAIWLRDNAPDPDTRSATNGQRLITVLDVPVTAAVASATMTKDGDLALAFSPDDHRTVFSADWLRRHSYDRPLPRDPGWVSPALELWDGRLAGAVPRGSYDLIRRDPDALREWLTAVRRLGVAVLSDVPRSSGSLVEVANLFGFVRETNYGRWFDVRAEVNPSNLAYTNLGLQAHTDNPYRDPVPTLQLLACLENSVEGGESTVVDGFAVADRLRREDPSAFALLARHPMRFAYAGSAGVRLEAKRPIVELGPDGEMIAVRFNNRSAAASTDIPYDDMVDFYAAYRAFAEILECTDMEVTFRLEPGELFIVDNTRVLHARKAFSGSGTRWLQGCYADKDGLLSTLASLEARDFRNAAE